MNQKFTQNLQSSSFNYQQSKTQPQSNTYYHSKRVSTQITPHQTIQLHVSSDKSSNHNQLPIIVKSKDHHNLSLSQVLHLTVQKLIQEEIKTGKIKVPQNQNNYQLKKQRKSPPKTIDTQTQLKQKLIQMQKKRLQTIQALKTLQDQQLQVKRQSVSFRYRKQSKQRNQIKKQRSHYSPQQKRQVKKMLMRQRLLQQQLHKKTEQIKQQYIKAIINQRQKHNIQIQKQKQMHRSFIEQKRPSIQQKKLQRLKILQLGNKKYQQIKNKRYFYQTQQEKDQKLAIQEIQQLNKKLENIKNKMKMPVKQELKQHQIKYNQIMKSRHATNNIKNSHFFTQSPHTQYKKRIQDNVFSQLVKAERQMKKKQQEISKNKVYQFKQKVKTFTQKCDTQIRPKIKITPESRFMPIESHRSVNSLNYFQQQKKGHQYLSAAKKMKKCQTLQDQKVLSNKGLESFENGPLKITYKNYLRQMRRLSQSNPQSDRKKFSVYLQKQGTISEFNSLHKAVVIAQSIYAKSKRSKNQKLIDAVQNKIQLLKMII